MLVTKFIEIDTAHRVPNHKSKCKNLHGHRYTIEVGVDDKVITIPGASSEGMVIDFGDLKEIMIEVIDTPLDHSGIYYKDDPNIEELKKIEADQMKLPGGKPMVFVPFIPTAENIAKYLYNKMHFALAAKNIAIKYVKVRETPTTMAMYNDPDYTEKLNPEDKIEL